MSFSENLLKKIRIKTLGRRIRASMGTVDSGKRTDIRAMRELLGMSPYTHHKERDLDLYLRKSETQKQSIIVLGNDLPMYLATVADVTMRRSPTVKEMISIRNAVKILNDADILVKKGHETLEAIQKECIALLDLTHTKDDLISIAEDGAASLENAYPDGVIESLSMLGELLDFQDPPKELEIGHLYIIGLSLQNQDQGTVYGPMVLYEKRHNALKFIDEAVAVFDKEKMDWIRQVAKGVKSVPVEGPAVFQALVESLLNKESEVPHA